MTEAEKVSVLSDRIAPDTDTYDVLEGVVSAAGALILNRMYPFGYARGTVVPYHYEELQLQLAVELYSKRGAEGQTAHSENGISRSWPEQSRLLAMVVPHCGSVVSNHA